MTVHTGARRFAPARLSKADLRALRQDARRRAKEPRLSAVPPHAFEPDRSLAPDHRGRECCRWCQTAGEPGDVRHPDGAPPMLPPVPAAAVEQSARILGERPED